MKRLLVLIAMAAGAVALGGCRYSGSASYYHDDYARHGYTYHRAEVYDYCPPPRGHYPSHGGYAGHGGYGGHGHDGPHRGR